MQAILKTNVLRTEAHGPYILALQQTSFGILWVVVIGSTANTSNQYGDRYVVKNLSLDFALLHKLLMMMLKQDMHV